MRPRVLATIFGGYVLVIAIIAWYFATGPGSGYAYGPDLTRWVYAVYMIVAAALLSGIAGASIGSMRHFDRLVEEAESAVEARSPEAELAAAEAEHPDALPPPLRETPAGTDRVDQDIDELLVSLQEIETNADETEDVVVGAVSREAAVVPKTSASAEARAAVNLEKWKRRRAQVPGFFAGPALIAIGIIAICAAMLPGADAMLQSNHQLNTALILGMGYAYGGIAAYAGASVYAILRRK